MNKMQWVIADRSGGDKREGAYETKIEAEVALERMRLAAVRTQYEAEARAREGRPWYTDDDNIKAVERFDSRGWHVKEEPLSDSVYRLNADIANDETFIREVLWKLRVCGKVEIGWTCIGHTRAEMQGASTAEFLSKHGYSVAVASGGDVVVLAKKKEVL